MAPKREKTIEETYQKKTQLEHVLHRPGMYIGDIETVQAERWIIENGTFIKKMVT
jgi:DNA topoisomerase-2